MFDLKKCEADLRANFERMKAAPLPHDANVEYVEAQNRGVEIEVQYVLWQLGEQNRGTSPVMILQSTGAMIASIICGASRMTGNDGVAMAIIMEAMAACIKDHQPFEPIKFENHDVAGSA